MMYFLDTNTCIDFLRKAKNPVHERLPKVPSEEIQIPVVVKVELLAGAFKSKDKDTLPRTELFLSQFTIIPFIDSMTYTYASIRASLEKLGTPIGSNDMLIAATALYCGATLVTHNTGEFSRVPGLSLEDWNI